MCNGIIVDYPAPDGRMTCVWCRNVALARAFLLDLHASGRHGTMRPTAFALHRVTGVSRRGSSPAAP